MLFCKATAALEGLFYKLGPQHALNQHVYGDWGTVNNILSVCWVTAGADTNC